ncbi:T9SS type A sorting domain-containing protein [Flavisolibacter sp. BT320]|nr:T9SS type A sorting domain-containing protein [Flavisolibacter longurius]
MKKFYMPSACANGIVFSPVFFLICTGNFFRKAAGFLAFALFSFFFSNGQNATATWSLTSTSNVAITGNLLTNSTNMAKGSGLVFTNYTGNAYGVRDGVTSSLSAAKAADDYLQFSVAPAAGFTFTLGSISSTLSVSDVAPTNNARYQVQYSTSSTFSNNVVNLGNTEALTMGSVSFTLNANILVGAGQSLYFRIYLWGLQNTNTTFRINNFRIQGNACPAVEISYPKAAFCKDPGATATPTRTGTAGGTYSAPAGLVMNSSTGVVDLAASTAGTYTVTYTAATGIAGCATVSATTNVTVNDLPTAFTLTGPDGATGSFCTNGTPATFTLSGSQEGVTYTFNAINPGGNTPPGQNFTVEGVGGTLEFVQTPDGKWSYKVTGQDDVTGCTNTMQGLLTAVDGPKVTSQPEATRTVCSGSTVTLTVGVSNATSLAWEVSPNGMTSWTSLAAGGQYSISKNGTSSTTLTISNVSVGLNGYRYRAVFGGPSACPINYSGGTMLAVSAQPVIATQPASKSICINSNFQLAVSALYGTSYQWYKNGVLLTGETGTTLTRSFTSASEAGTYYVMVTGSCGSVRSNDAIMSANTTPTSTTWQGPVPGANTGNGTAWEVSANWSCGVPTRTIDAIIPADIMDGFPTIKPAVSGEVRNLTIQAGALGGFLTVDGRLQIFGAVSNSGVFTADNGTIEYSGSTAQTIAANTFANNTVKNLVISNNVSLNGPLNLTGTLSFGEVNNRIFTTNHHLTLASSASVTARIADITNNGVNAGNAITGNVVVERFIPQHSSRRYRLVTAPVKGVSINQAWQEGRTWNGVTTETSGNGTLITGQQQGTATNAASKGFDFWPAIAGGGASVRKYVGSSSASSNIDATFAPVDNTVTAGFSSHEAYLVYIRGDRSVSTGTAAGSALLRAKGPLKQETAYTIPVSNTQSHTLIGNPYASPINFQKLYADNSTKIQPWYWTWQASLGSNMGGYVLMLPDGEGGYEPVPSVSGSSTQPVIGSGEGFFVVPAPGAAAGNAILLKEMHKDNNRPTLALFRQAGPTAAKVRVNLFAQLNGEKTLLDGVSARFGEGQNINLNKAVNTGENLTIWKGGKDMIVASSSLAQAGDSIQLRFWNLAARSYTLELGNNRLPQGVQAVLFDRYRGTETALGAGPETVYSFEVNADAGSKAPLRFVIRFKKHQVLPVKLVSFTAQQGTKAVSLEWKVEEEGAVRDYTVERKGEMGEFTPVLTQAARGAVGAQVYGESDRNPIAMAYYRLKIREHSGAFHYSDIVRVQSGQPAGTVSLYPNPVQGKTVNLQMGAKPKAVYTLTMYSPAGQVVAIRDIQHAGNSAVYPVSVQALASGTYLLELTDAGGKKERMQLVVAK